MQATREADADQFEIETELSQNKDKLIHTLRLTT